MRVNSYSVLLPETNAPLPISGGVSPCMTMMEDPSFFSAPFRKFSPMLVTLAGMLIYSRMFASAVFFEGA